MHPSRRVILGSGAALVGTAAWRAPAEAAVAEAPGRTVERLADWRFHLGHAADPERDFGWGRHQRTFAKAGAATADAAQATHDDRHWRHVVVPHDWAVELPFARPALPAAEDMKDMAAAHGFKAIGRGFPENSVGWYRCPIAVTAADRNRVLWLEFDGVFRQATVFVNGYVVVTNESGYAPFRAEIGDFLDYDGGANVITVRADASLGEGWFYEGAGIYRHVDLVRAASVHVPQWGEVVRSEIEAAGARVRVTTEVRNAGIASAQVVVRRRVLDGEGREVAVLPEQSVTVGVGKTVHATGETVLRAPALWQPDTPNLYRIATELLVGSAVTDRIETGFGVRAIRFDAAQGFLLNGRAVKLLGTCNHQDHAGVGTSIPDALHAWRIDQLREMGSNAWRSAHNPPAAAFLDLCDAKGMMVICETRRNSTDPVAIDEMERMIRRDRNHPSVILWSLGNEEPHQGSERGARITRALQARVRELDPTRPTTFALDNSWDKGVGRVVDVVGFNYRTDQIEAFHGANPEVPVYGSETGSTVSTRGAYVTDKAAHVVRAYDTEHPWWASTAEAWWTIAAERPYIAGGFIWTGFDYRGEPTPYPEFPSISSYFGVLDTCGFAKDNFHYYRAWWRPDVPQVHLLPHWTWPGRDGQPIEVWAHSNCAEVELLLNGRSLGRKAMPRNRHLAWSVPYAPGRLEARGYDHGRVTARDLRETAGAAAALRLSSDRRMLRASGGDVAILRAEVVDARGRAVPDAADLISFTVSGPADVIGVGNGDPTSLEPDHARERRAFHGLAQAILRTRRRAGPIIVGAEAAQLATAQVKLISVPD